MTGPTLYERWSLSESDDLPRPIVVKGRVWRRWFGWRPIDGTQAFDTWSEAVAYATGGQR